MTPIASSKPAASATLRMPNKRPIRIAGPSASMRNNRAPIPGVNSAITPRAARVPARIGNAEERWKGCADMRCPDYSLTFGTMGPGAGMANMVSVMHTP